MHDMLRDMTTNGELAVPRRLSPALLYSYSAEPVQLSSLPLRLPFRQSGCEKACVCLAALRNKACRISAHHSMPEAQKRCRILAQHRGDAMRIVLSDGR